MKVASSLESGGVELPLGQQVSCESAVGENRDVTAEYQVSAEEIDRLRDEKLQLIRQLIEQGKYDSDEMLEKALTRMIAAITDAEEIQDLGG